MRLLLLVTFWLLAASPALGQSKAYLKCQAMLDENAAKHRARSDKALAKQQRAINELIEDYVGAQSPDRASSDRVSEIVALVMSYEYLDEAREKYVDAAIDELTNLTAADDENFSCAKNVYIVNVYARYRKVYEDILERSIESVRQRLAIEDVSEDEGLAIISFSLGDYSGGVEINRRGSLRGSFEIGPVGPGTVYRVVKLKAGTYNWNRIWRQSGFGPIDYRFEKRNLSFTVEPGKLNYAGQLIFRSQSFGLARIGVHDRASDILTVLEQRYPDLLENYEIVNGISEGNTFIDFYLREKAAVVSNRDQ